LTHNQEVVGVTSGLFHECFLYVYCIISCEFNQNVILYCLTVCLDDIVVKELDSQSRVCAFYFWLLHFHVTLGKLFTLTHTHVPQPCSLVLANNGDVVWLGR